MACKEELLPLNTFIEYNVSWIDNLAKNCIENTVKPASGTICTERSSAAIYCRPDLLCYHVLHFVSLLIAT